jgi:nicotinic acid phosphoribosyltransferase
MTLEGPAQALLVNETLLHYLTTGTRARTLAGGYPAKSFPWVFMGARYLAGEDLAIFTRALAAEGILSTVPRWADKFIGTESHSQIVMWGGLRLDEQTEKVISDVASDDRVAATIRATVAFARANPRVPLYVLGDFAARSLGCAEVFRATDTACRRLGLQLAGGRMDISKCDLNDVPIFDKAVKNLFEAEDKKLGYVAVDEEEGNYSEYHANKKARQDLQSRYCGMGIEAVRTVRRQLDEAGMKSFKLVVSSGIKLDDIKTYAQAGASMVGIGEEAAYYLNQGQCNYTSDAIGYFEGDKLIPFAKEGRELSRLLDPLVIDNAHLGVKIAKNLERHNLADYL